MENRISSHHQRKAMSSNRFEVLTVKNASRIVAKARVFMSNLVAYVDGGSQGNPGRAGVGLVIDGSANGTVKIKKWIGHQDNNVAEYVALLEALQFALDFGAKTLHVFSDSEV